MTDFSPPWLPPDPPGGPGQALKGERLRSFNILSMVGLLLGDCGEEATEVS